MAGDDHLLVPLDPFEQGGEAGPEPGGLDPARGGAALSPHGAWRTEAAGVQVRNSRPRSE